jgi:HEPN domain-containing protein
MILSSSTLEWVEFAEHDYLTAQTLLHVSKVPFEIVAYHCQQLAEKYLKALLIQNGLPVPLIHDLAKVTRLAQGAHPGLKDVEATCELLTPFGTATRYPGSAMRVGPEHMPSVIGWAESIRRFVRDAFGLK